MLFLDEPTTGLDPRSRLGLWETIEDRVAGGTTVLLTTQYLDEADRLADSIAVIDRGRVVAQGTADELKTRVGGERLEVTLVPGADTGAALAALAPVAAGDPPSNRDGVICVPVHGRTAITQAVRELDAVGVGIEDIALRRPTLDDVFLTLTGHAADEVDDADGAAGVAGRAQSA